MTLKNKYTNYTLLSLLVVTALAFASFDQRAYAEVVTFTTDTTITVDETITGDDIWVVQDGVILTIDSGTVIVIEGKLLLASSSEAATIDNFGTIINNGILTLVSVNNYGIIENNDSMTSIGIMNNFGTINGLGNLFYTGIINIKCGGVLMGNNLIPISLPPPLPQPQLVHESPCIAIIQVDIDIKPGSDPNCFNNDGHGTIPVAILGSATFDVNDIDAGTVQLEGMDLRAVGNSNKLLASIEDTNNDGIDDLIVQIEDQDGIFEQGTATAILTGSLFDGTQIEGTDSICITQ